MKDSLRNLFIPVVFVSYVGLSGCGIGQSDSEDDFLKKAKEEYEPRGYTNFSVPFSTDAGTPFGVDNLGARGRVNMSGKDGRTYYVQVQKRIDGTVGMFPLERDDPFNAVDLKMVPQSE